MHSGGLYIASYNFVNFLWNSHFFFWQNHWAMSLLQFNLQSAKTLGTANLNGKCVTADLRVCVKLSYKR